MSFQHHETTTQFARLYRTEKTVRWAFTTKPAAKFPMKISVVYDPANDEEKSEISIATGDDFENERRYTKKIPVNELRSPQFFQTLRKMHKDEQLRSSTPIVVTSRSSTPALAPALAPACAIPPAPHFVPSELRDSWEDA